MGYTLLSALPKLQSDQKIAVYIPTIQVLSKYLSLFLELSNFLENQSFLILQTVLRNLIQTLKPSSKYQLRELLFNSPNMKWILFFNENCRDSFRSRRISFNESLDLVMKRLVQAAIAYLSLNYSVTPVIITDPSEPQDNYETNPPLLTITFEEFLQQMNSTNKISSVLESYRLLTQSGDNTEHNLKSTALKERLFSPHLSWKEIELGLNSGDLYTGILKLSDFSPNYGEVLLKQGMVATTTASSSSADSSKNNHCWPSYHSVIISGWENMNRSLDGDTVVIQLLPRSDWKTIQSHHLLQAPINTEIEELEAAASGFGDGDDEINLETKLHDLSLRQQSNNLENQKRMTAGPALPTAKVVAILKRDIVEVVVTIPKSTSTLNSLSQNKSAVCTQPNREEYVLCLPLIRKLPKIRIRTRQWELLQGQRVVVGIDNWGIDSRYPNGHFLKCIGAKGDWKTEIDALLIKYSVFPRPFSVAALACLPSTSLSSTLSQEDCVVDNKLEKSSCKQVWIDSGWIPPTIEGRRDMRNHRVFSVDPPGCQDIDDAMSVEWISDGVIEISIHIADVCAFVEQGSPLDLEAQVRSTTIYLSHKRIDMLPSLLSSDIASLHGNKERYAVTMTFRINLHHADGRPIKESEKQLALDLDKNNDIIFDIPTLPIWAGRTVICSTAAMTYDQGDNLLNNRSPNDSDERPVPEGQAGRPIPKHFWSLLRGDLCILTVFSRQLQRSRFANNAIDLSQQEGGQLKFRLDENGYPMAYSDTPHKEIHDTIAELMILANGAAAKLIYLEFPKATLFRNHTSPSIERLREVQEIVEGLGLSDVFVGTTDEELLNHMISFKQSLTKNRKSNPAVVHLITSLVIRAMSEARYISSENDNSNILGRNGDPIRHYGLGVVYYTHFTSPIRRYADVIVHRQLLRALEIKQQRLITPKLMKSSEVSQHDSINVILPESKAISIMQDDKLISGDDLSSNQIQMNLAPDGRKMYDKISSTASVSSSSSSPPLAAAVATSLIRQEKIPSPAVQTIPETDDDLDLLDSLLDGVGDDLLDSFQATRSQPTHVISPPHQPLIEQKQEISVENELDALLGDINEDSLSYAAAATVATAANAATASSTSASASSSELSELTPAAKATEIIATTHEKEDKHKEEEPSKDQESTADNSLLAPYPPRQLASIADHLNKMNRRAKIVQWECQQLFLRHYFLNREEKHIAVITTLKENGFIAYVPSIDFKGAVYLMTNDNSSVCCRPQLLSLSNTSGLSVSTPQYAGKKENLALFPTHSCQLIQSKVGTESESELVIFPKSSTPNNATGKGTLRLRVMQRVVVSIYSSTIQVDGIPELSLQLWSLDLSTKLSSNDLSSSPQEATTHTNENQINLPSTTPLSSSSSSSSSTPSSLYHLFMEIISDEKLQKKRQKKNGNKKLNKVIQSRRIACQGTGRVAFGDEEEREYFASLFHLMTAATTSSSGGTAASSSSSASGEIANDGNMMRGKALAMHQMKLWGEEWAEEEDLPSTEYPVEDTQTSSGIPSGFNLKKESNIANQRIQKLKVAKRNSKY